MASKSSKAQNEPEAFSAKVVSPAGNEYNVSNPVEYYNLRARGYADVDASASERAVAQAEQAATSQTMGPADGASQVGAPS